MCMSGEGGTPLEEFEEAARKFLARSERRVDPKRYRAVIDSLDGDFSANARDCARAGEHLVAGNITAASWIARTCGMSISSAADRVRVGEQLESLPKVAAALSSGEISFQSASVLCHLHERLGENRDGFDEEEMVGCAREFSVFELRKLCRFAWHVANPDGFFNEAEAVGELALHAMDQGPLPRRHSVKPHINLTMTLEGLKGELGVPPADLDLSLPISTRTAERLACDCTMSRVLLADSMVIDVGRATRTVSAPTARALRVRDKGCRFPGCDRQVHWSSPHHLIYWSRGGPSKLSNLVLLCYFHHRLVHEGGWQVIRVGREFRFLPPERIVMRRARGLGMRWAA